MVKKNDANIKTKTIFWKIRDQQKLDST